MMIMIIPIYHTAKEGGTYVGQMVTVCHVFLGRRRRDARLAAGAAGGHIRRRRRFLGPWSYVFGTPIVKFYTQPGDLSFTVLFSVWKFPRIEISGKF